MNENSDNIRKIQDEFDSIRPDVDPSKFMVTDENLPDYGEIEVYDYESDIQSAISQADEVLKSLVDLYLGDSEAIKNHPYISTKMREDAEVYGESILLSKMTRRLLLIQLTQVDNGDKSPRMYEVVNQTLTQVRENNKYNKSSRTDIEKFWKEIRKDLGLNEMKADSGSDKDNKSKDKLVDQKDLNTMLDDILKNRK